MLMQEYIIFIVITILLHIGVVFLVTRKPRKSIKGRHIVVTGGSSGIGLWVAIHCVKLEANVTIIARNVNVLEKAIELLESHRTSDAQKIQYKSLDLSKSYDQTAKTFDELETDFGQIFMLVNCAGMAICGENAIPDEMQWKIQILQLKDDLFVIVPGTIEETSIEDAHQMMNCNYFGTYYPTRYCLPKMKANGEGIIVITASQAALMGIYGYGAYGAAKFALRGLAETIAMEASHCGVSVTLALPADTDTPGYAREEKTKPKETKIISASGGLAKPEDVAKQLIDDALKGKFFSIIGIESWLLTILCSGMAPWGGIVLNFLIAMTIAPIKVIGQIIQWNFRRIVRNCAKEQTTVHE